MGAAEVAAFENIFYDYFRDKMEDLAMQGKKSLILEEEDLGKIDVALMDYIIEQPKYAFMDAMKALDNIELMSGKLKYLRIKKLEGRNIRISDIRTNHIGKLWQFEGTVRKATDVYPLIVKSAWECVKCGSITVVDEMNNPFSIPVRRTRSPVYCEHCGRKSVFKMVKEKNVEINMQRIEIQENIEEATQPKSIEVVLFDDITGKIMPGDRVRVVGILDTDHVWKERNILSASLKYVVIAVYVEPIEKTFEEIELTPDDIKEIENAAKDEKIYEKLTKSIAPSIYGLEDIKEAILLQLFGGVPKVRKDGTRVRGDIHILLAGDPSTAKSQLLRYVVTLSPKGIYTVGGGGTYVGLTASVTKSDFGDGRWVLEAGAMVLADGGLIAVDELDKMKQEERNALHSAMEQQIIVIDKAGIHATLKTRCPVLAGCNPKLGRFDKYKDDIEQIMLPASLLSRFDLIFILKDIPDEKKDRMMAEHILNLHRNDDYATPIFSNSFIRKYVSYARRNVFPRLNKDAAKIIENFYVNMRKLSTDTSISITPRYLEALIRLAEASARIRLSDVATAEDAGRAIRIMSKTLEYIKTENGTPDVDKVESAISSKKRDKYMTVLNIITDKFKEDRNPVKKEYIVEEAEKEGIDELIVDKIIEGLKTNGLIIERKYGEYEPV